MNQSTRRHSLSFPPASIRYIFTPAGKCVRCDDVACTDPPDDRGLRPGSLEERERELLAAAQHNAHLAEQLQAAVERHAEDLASLHEVPGRRPGHRGPHAVPGSIARAGGLARPAASSASSRTIWTPGRSFPPPCSPASLAIGPGDPNLFVPRRLAFGRVFERASISTKTSGDDCSLVL